MLSKNRLSNILSFCLGLLPVFSNFIDYRSIIEALCLASIFALTACASFRYVTLFLAAFITLNQFYFDASLYSLPLLLWGLVVTIYFSNPRSLLTSTTGFYNGLFLGLILNLNYIYFFPDSDPQGRFQGLYSSVLAYGFVVSALAILTMLMSFNPKYKFLILFFLALAALPSGSRHPILICLMCAFLFLFQMGRSCLYWIIPILVLALSLSSFLDIENLRALNSNEYSDTERLDRFSDFFSNVDFISLLFGSGRSNVGSLSISLGFDVGRVIESSFVTYIYSYGLLVFMIVSLLCTYRLFIIRKSYKFSMALFIILLVNGMVSQSFENPTMLMVYIITLSSVLFFNNKNHSAYAS